MCGDISRIQKSPGFGESRCDRCKTVVTKVSEGLMPGGGLRERDAFLALATLAPDEWRGTLPGVKDADKVRTDALTGGGNGLGPIVHLREFMLKVVSACVSGNVTSTKPVKGKGQDSVNLCKETYTWRTYFVGVQLKYDGSDAHEAKVPWPPRPGECSPLRTPRCV